MNFLTRTHSCGSLTGLILINYNFLKKKTGLETLDISVDWTGMLWRTYSEQGSMAIQCSITG